MLCPSCQFESPQGMKFCGQCGSRLPRLCSRCGQAVPEDFKFCGACGHRLAAVAGAARSAAPEESIAGVGPAGNLEAAEPRPSPSPGSPPAAPVASPPASPAETGGSTEGERKQVTSLLCQLDCGPAESLDAEALHALMSRFLPLAEREVERYGGTIHQTLHQGVLALFGVSRAYEDQASRAVLAALAIRGKLADGGGAIEGPGGARCGVRTALGTGLMVIGGVGDMVIGDTTRRVEVLGSRAAPGEILVGERLEALIRHRFELQPVESQGSEPAAAFRVLGAGSRRDSQSPLLGRRLSPYIGRTRELATLEELRDLAERGEGQVVGVVGEAGSGKSRLLHEFGRAVADRPQSYLRGRCLSYGSGVPYLPFVDMIRRASNLRDSNTPEEMVSKLRASLEAVGQPTADSLPFFQRLLGIPDESGALDELGARAIQARTFAAMRRMVLDASRQALVVMEIEDLQWIDSTSESFLASLVETVGATRVLLLLTYRSGYQPSWLERSYCSQIALQRLSVEESRALASAILGDQVPPRQWSERVLDKAQGNPFFLEELAYSLGAEENGSEAPVPDTIQGVLMARIDRLPSAHKNLLRTAAVLGREFSLELLAKVWRQSEELSPLVEDLQRWELLYRAPYEDRTTFFFRQNLIQEMAYQSLLSEGRRELHELAAGAIETLYRDHLQDAYGSLAHHYAASGQPEKTVHYLGLLAGRAAGDYAHAEAARALREALEHAARLPEEIRDRRRIELLLELAESLLPLAQFPETLALWNENAELPARVGDPVLSARFSFWLAHTHTYLGNQAEARENAERALAEARACGDETTEGKACYVLAREGFWAGRFAEGVRYSQRAIVLLERGGESWWQGQAHWVAGFNRYAVGEIEEGIDALERAQRIGEALDDYRLDTSWSQGYFYAALGEWEAGIEKCRQSVESSQDPLNTAVATGFLGYAYLRKGDRSLAISTLRDAARQLRDTGMSQILGWFRVFLAQAYLADGQLAEAEEQVAMGLETCRSVNFRLGTGLALRAEGEIALERGSLDRADASLRAASETFESLQAPFESARTHLVRARLAREAGEPQTVAAELAAARRIFTDLGLAGSLQEVEDLGAEWGVG